MKHLKSCTMNCCSLCSTDIEPITASLSDLPSLVELDLSENKSLSGSGESWAHLMHLQQLQVLELNMCALIIDDLNNIAASVSRMEKLTRCSIDESMQFC